MAGLTEKQIAARAKGVGASESAIVLGLNEHVSPYQLWLQKTGRIIAEDISNLAPVYWGTIHEETIAQEYAKVFNCSVRRVSNTIVHKTKPFILCHIDRKVEGLAKVLECKFAMRHSDNWGESGSDVVPLTYIVQVQHQLACTGYAEGDLAVLIAGWDFRVYHFKRDEAIIATIETALTDFWHCVETDTPPALRDKTDASLAYPLSNGNYIEVDSVSIKEELEKYICARTSIAELEDQKKKAADQITLFIKKADGLKSNGKFVATWKPTKNGNRVLRVMERGLHE